jgi:hypothetical protein
MTGLEIACLVVSYLCAFACGIQLMNKSYHWAAYNAIACIINIIAAFC